MSFRRPRVVRFAASMALVVGCGAACTTFGTDPETTPGSDSGVDTGAPVTDGATTPSGVDADVPEVEPPVPDSGTRCKPVWSVPPSASDSFKGWIADTRGTTGQPSPPLDVATVRGDTWLTTTLDQPLGSFYTVRSRTLQQGPEPALEKLVRVRFEVFVDVPAVWLAGRVGIAQLVSVLAPNGVPTSNLSIQLATDSTVGIGVEGPAPRLEVLTIKPLATPKYRFVLETWLDTANGQAWIEVAGRASNKISVPDLATAGGLLQLGPFFNYGPGPATFAIGYRDVHVENCERAPK